MARYCWLFSLLLVIGCEPNRMFGSGGSGVGPFLVRMDGKPVEKQIVRIAVPPPWWIPATVYLEDYVVDSAPDPADQRAIDRLVDRAPPWSRLTARGTYGATDIAMNATADQPIYLVRWIISLRPLVVGLGPAPAASSRPRSDFSGPGEYHDYYGDVWMITKDDLDAHVSTLVVIDPFPDHCHDLHPATRLYQLPNPTTLRDLLYGNRLPTEALIIPARPRPTLFTAEESEENGGIGMSLGA